MENTTPGPLKINLTSTPCMKRKSLFAAPDVSPIRNGTNSKRNSATSIVSKIPVKLAARKLSTRIPKLSGQTKTSEPEKPVLRTIDNIDQTDATEKNKGKKGNKSPKVAATNKEASLSERASTSTSSKKNGVDNLSKMEWEAMEILSHEVLSPVSKRGSNLDIDLDDDDNGDFEPTKKEKKNQSNSKKCPSPKKGKQTDLKGADKKPAKSARGKKKADAEDTEVILENIPEETKINSKMQLDGETANKIAETRRVVKKGPNKDQKKPPARNKRKFADSDLEPVVEESNNAEDEKKVVTRNTRKTVGGDFEPVAEVDEEAMDVEDEPKSPVRKKRTFDLGPVAEEPKNVEDPKDSLPKNKNGTFDLGPVADEPKNLEDQNKTPTRNKRKSADFHPEKAEEPIEVEGKRKRPTRNVKKTSSAPAPDVIAETKAIDAEMKEEPAKTRKMPRAKKMKADKKEKDCASEPSVEVPEEEKNEDALNVDEKAVERSSPAKKKVVGFNSFNASGGKRQIPLNRIFGNPLITDSKESPTPVKVFRSIKPSENVMGGFISLLPSSSHSGLSTNYNLYFLMSDTQLKVNIMGVERIIENQLTSFVVPKDCRFSIENVGSGTAILSFTKLRSI